MDTDFYVKGYIEFEQNQNLSEPRPNFIVLILNFAVIFLIG